MTKDELRAEYESSSPKHAKAIYGENAPVTMQGLACPRYLAYVEERLLQALQTIEDADKVDPMWRQKIGKPKKQSVRMDEVLLFSEESQ